MMHKYFKNVVDSIFVGALAFKIDTEACVYANKVAIDILGAEPAGLRLPDLFLDAIDGQTTFNAEIARNEGVFQDTLIKRTSGDFFIANVQVQFLGGELLFITFEDLTRQKKLQREVYTKEAELRRNAAELLSQNQQLRELDKAKNRFFALTSHELRTPLSSILATAQFIVDGLCNTEDELNGYVNVILQEGKRLLDIVNDVLDFSKIQAGKLDLFVEKRFLSDLINERVVQMKKFAKTKNVQIYFDHVPSAYESYFDALRMAQVIDNVLNNAVKFNREGGTIRVTCEAWPRDAEPEGAGFEIRIADTGEGIPAEHVGKVFNEFETVENIHNHHKGTGLGMPICKKLMEFMGGKIDFETRFGEGTTFIIQVPAHQVLEASVYRSRAPRATEAA